MSNIGSSGDCGTTPLIYPLAIVMMVPSRNLHHNLFTTFIRTFSQLRGVTTEAHPVVAAVAADRRAFPWPQGGLTIALPISNLLTIAWPGFSACTDCRPNALLTAFLGVCCGIRHWPAGYVWVVQQWQSGGCCFRDKGSAIGREGCQAGGTPGVPAGAGQIVGGCC